MILYDIGQVETLVNKYQELGDTLFEKSTSPIQVDHSYARSRNGAVAYLTQWRIVMNAPLFMLHPTELEQVVGHEVAHLYAYDQYGDVGHGKDWQGVMKDFGLVPDQYHSMVGSEIVGRNPKNHLWKCTYCDGQFYVTNKKHKNMHRVNGRGYTHVRCGAKTELKFVEYTSNEMKIATMVAKGKMSPNALIALKQEPELFIRPRPPETKINRAAECRELFRKDPNLSRSRMIAKFMIQVGVTHSTASSYYHRCRTLYFKEAA